MKQVVVISGGTEGLGKEIARTLTSDYQVVILSPTEEKLKKVANELGCDYQICDISVWDNCYKTVLNILKKYGQIDCLINNAGIYIEQELELNDSNRIKEVFGVNTLGTIYLTKAVIPTMKKNRRGLIVNIISQAGLVGQNGKSIYNSSKWAITGFTKCMQIELSKYNIAVTGIYPGKLDTNMFKNMGIEKDMSNALNTENVAKTVQFILSFDNKVVIPELGIKNINN